MLDVKIAYAGSIYSQRNRMRFCLKVKAVVTQNDYKFDGDYTINIVRSAWQGMHIKYSVSAVSGPVVDNPTMSISQSTKRSCQRMALLFTIQDTVFAKESTIIFGNLSEFKLIHNKITYEKLKKYICRPI